MAERKQDRKQQEQDSTKRQVSCSIEETFMRIDELITQLESPEIGLEDSFQAYEEGMKLLKACNEQIDRVEKKVLVLSGDGGFDELGE
ncbi:MAG: exodeoxyribonuclease VII small subunit [Lachnospiraceae bacterium]|nr:exodeoxyribonuclease VII small subunit [Lachnospiraceae bacterium]MBD5483454.1 exodeoxyribonuclease VII small subunit [Lachnospiraceae bacterium]